MRSPRLNADKDAVATMSQTTAVRASGEFAIGFRKSLLALSKRPPKRKVLSPIKTAAFAFVVPICESIWRYVDHRWAMLCSVVSEFDDCVFDIDASMTALI